MNRRKFFGVLLGGVAVAAGALGFKKQVPPLCYNPADARNLFSGKWVNYTFEYTDVGKEQMIALLEQAIKETVFVPPSLDKAMMGIEYWISKKTLT